MIDEEVYQEKFPLTAVVIPLEDGRWGWKIRRGKIDIAQHVLPAETAGKARKSLERILFAIRHNTKPVRIIDQ
jgi:hypothetical protein